MSATELPEAPVFVQPDEWKHVVVLDKLADAAGKPSTNPLLLCIHCDKEFRGASDRIRAHLAHTPGAGVTGCTKCLPAVTACFQKAQTSKAAQKDKKRKLAQLDELSRSN